MNKEFRNSEPNNFFVERAENFKTMFELFNVPMKIISPSGKVLKVNKAFCDLLGYEEIELLEMNFLEFTSPSERDSKLELLKQLNSGESKSLEFEKRYIKKNGDIILAKVSSILIRDAFGNEEFIAVTAENITDRKKAEQEIIESEKKYRQLIENASEIILLTDKEGNFTFANEAALKFSGYTFAEMTSFNFLDLVHKDYRNKVSSFYYRQFIRRDEITSLQFPFYTKDRSFKWLEQNVKLLTDGEKIAGFQLIARDITERVKAEEKVKLLTRAVENSPASIMITDEQGNIEYVNQKFIALTGYTLEEVKGKNPRILKSGEKSEDEYKILWESIRAGKEWRGEFHNKKKNGELYWESASIVQVKNGKTFYLAVKEDITEQKRTEVVLKESKERFEQVTSSSGEWVWEIDVHGLYTYSSIAVEDILGYSPEEIVGKKHFYDLFDPEIRDEIKEAAILMMDKKEIIKNLMNLNLHKNGDKVYLETNGIPLLDSNGNLIGYRGADKDITERRRIQKELIKAKDKAEESNKLKDFFIANISHEIRTPLNGILGMASIIREVYSNNISGDEEEYFAAIDKSSARIIRTIDLILNYSQLETGTFNFVPSQIELSTICEILIHKFSEAAHAKSLSFSFENKIGQALISASEYSMVHVISNLIENAVIFTKTGFVKVQLYQNLQDEMLLDIIDSGIGISDEYLTHIFEPFRQEQMGYGRTYEGLGLGLAMVKKILDLHHAAISVKSKKGEGTTFSINFGKGSKNVAQKFITQNTSVKEEPPERKTDRLVLIVEDDKINQATIKRFINKKYNTLEADSYKSVMEILAANKVDLILMDISLQGSIDGLEIAKALKASSEYKHIPVIAVTAHALERDHQAVMAAGCDDYLAKPFSKGQLLRKIDEFLS